MKYAGNTNLRAINLGITIAKPGITLLDLNDVIEKTIRFDGCEPAFKDYRGYPAAACISVNDGVVHGIPNNYVIRAGDLITIDVGTRYQGWCVDAARSFVVRGPTMFPLREALVNAGEDILAAELQVVKDGVSLWDIANAGHQETARQRVSLIIEWGGHQIGQTIHIDPFIPNGFNHSKGPLGVTLEAQRLKGQILHTGQAICLEPVVTLGSTETIIDADCWTIRSKHGNNVTHTERCILITNEGYEILT